MLTDARDEGEKEGGGRNEGVEKKGRGKREEVGGEREV